MRMVCHTRRGGNNKELSARSSVAKASKHSFGKRLATARASIAKDTDDLHALAKRIRSQANAQRESDGALYEPKDGKGQSMLVEYRLTARGVVKKELEKFASSTPPCRLCYHHDRLAGPSKNPFFALRAYRSVGYPDHGGDGLDLSPYVCLVERCKTSLQTYRSLSEWRRHTDGAHGEVSWSCVYCPDQIFAKENSFKDHVHGHDFGFTDKEFELMVRARHSKEFRFERCLLCGFRNGPAKEGCDPRKYRRECQEQVRVCMGKHMEAIAEASLCGTDLAI